MNSRLNFVRIAQAYRRIYQSAFSHLPHIPRLYVIPGRAVAGEYACSENDDDWSHELCGFFDPDSFKIVIFPDNHETYFDAYSTLVHELTHVEQFHRKQPLTHGPRFDRRRRKLAARVKLGNLSPNASNFGNA
jgi:hypothetical protein